MVTATAEARCASRRHLSRRLVVLALTVLGVAACGGVAVPPPVESGPAGVAAPSAEALAAVRGATAGALSGTAGFSETFERATLFGGPASSATATGSFDFRSLRGEMSVAAPGATQNEPVVFAPLAVYVRPPASGSSLPSGKSWMVANFSDTKALTTNFPEFIAQVESVNPALTLSELLWGSTSAAVTGRPVTGGQAVTEYAVTVDLQRALANASGTAQVPFVQTLRSQIREAGRSASTSSPAPVSTTLKARVWVTGTGRLERIVLSPPGAGVGRSTLAFTRFGTTVHAQPPPAGQVVDVRAITPSGERENQNGGDSDGA